ncbi:BTB domain-containing protein [Favolaschia claudopus]|uniref:BTB domain-containing protein n=1 Tax=Favolaschia claudopus TaxID=2862362 RepID=A0AAV9ZTB0_9AGAR
MDSAPPPDVRRVEDLWFPHAALILRAENTLFRVHSDILSARSSVFQDMISFPQPTQPDGETVDGCVVVRLQDSAAELEAFLRAIFDSSFFERRPSPVEFFTTVGVMRLAHKYDVPYLFRRALTHLDAIYPTNLQKLQGIRSAHIDHHIYYTTFVPHVHMITLQVVSEVGATWILPAVYYSIASDSDFMRQAADHMHPHAMLRALIAQTEFVRATASTHHFLRELPSSGCATHAKCTAHISAAHDSLELWLEHRDDCDPLSAWVFDYMEDDLQLCSACSAVGEKMYQEAQEKFWDSLPGILGLPDWAELKRSKLDVVLVEDTP